MYVPTSWVDDVTLVNASRLNNLESGVVALDSGVGTSLPGSPVDGQEYTLVDSTTAPTYAWRFRYTTSISDGNKWVYIGGSPAIAEVATSESPGSTGAYVALSTAGPSFVLPRVGVYVVEISALMNLATTAGNSCRMSYDIGATGAVDGDSIVHLSPGGGTPNFAAHSNRAMAKTFASAVTLTSKYKASATAATFASRWLRVTPVRVA